jgi:hypothetical protein
MARDRATQRQDSVPQGLSRNALIGLMYAGFAILTAVLLFTEHRTHVLGLLVWLPLLACPLMHLFMHRHHGRHDRPHG